MVLKLVGRLGGFVRRLLMGVMMVFLRLLVVWVGVVWVGVGGL